MTRKDFIAFANMLASHEGFEGYGESEDFSRGYEAARQDIGRSVAAVCRTSNDNFDAVKFYDAAKLGG
jgi:hypothetical protein